MIYKKHFSKDYLELELQKKEFETRIQRALEAGDCVEAQRFCDKRLCPPGEHRAKPNNKKTPLRSPGSPQRCFFVSLPLVCGIKIPPMAAAIGGMNCVVAWELAFISRPLPAIRLPREGLGPSAVRCGGCPFPER